MPALPKNEGFGPARPRAGIKPDAMQPQQPGGSALAGRRADAGTVKLTDRDITGLMLCADHLRRPV